MKSLTKIEKLRDFIVPKMTYLITFPDNNGKSAVYMGGNIHGARATDGFLECTDIQFPWTLTLSGND